eukprot:COSAG06_NODE_670_length_13210_cov_6.810464_11_plen_197_part_00
MSRTRKRYVYRSTSRSSCRRRLHHHDIRETWLTFTTTPSLRHLLRALPTSTSRCPHLTIMRATTAASPPTTTPPSTTTTLTWRYRQHLTCTCACALARCYTTTTGTTPLLHHHYYTTATPPLHRKHYHPDTRARARARANPDPSRGEEASQPYQHQTVIPLPSAVQVNASSAFVKRNATAPGIERKERSTSVRYSK